MNLIYSNPRFQAWDKDNTFLAYGRLSIYDAGTLDLKAIYDSEGVELANPQILNNVGKVAVNGIYADSGDYKLVYERRNDDGTYTAIDTIDDVPNNDSGTVSGNTGIVDSIVDLRALDVPTEQTTIIVSRYYDDYLNGGGVYVWDSTSTLDDDNFSVIQSGSLPAIGRFLRTFETLDINPYMCGCIPDNTLEDNQTRMTQLFLFGSLNPQYRIILPKGTWYCSGNLTVNSNFKAEHGAIIDKVSVSPSTFSFGPNALIDIPFDSLFLGGEGLKYFLYIDDGAKTIDDRVSIEWVSQDCGIVSTNNNSLSKFLVSLNNFQSGIVISKYHYIDANIHNFEGKTLILKDGGSILAEDDANMTLPDKIVDERGNKLLGGIGGILRHQNSANTYPLSAFTRDSVTLYFLTSYTETIPIGTIITIDDDYHYTGTEPVITHEHITFVPAGGVLSNSSGKTITFNSSIAKIPLYWLDNVSLNNIDFQKGDLMLAWFWSDSGLLPSSLSIIADNGLWIDLDGAIFDMGDNPFTIVNGSIKIKNGSMHMSDQFRVPDAVNVDFKNLIIESSADVLIQVHATDICNIKLVDTQFTGTTFDIACGATFEMGDFIMDKFICNAPFSYSTQIFPLNSTSILSFYADFSGGTVVPSVRYAQNCKFNGITSFDTLALMEFRNNLFANDNTNWITCASITVRDNISPEGRFIVGGGIQNVGDVWKLINVCFINNEFIDSFNITTGLNTGIFPNDYVDIRTNHISSVFKGNFCSGTVGHGIANNEIEYYHEWEGATYPVGGTWEGGTKVWYLAVSGVGDSSVIPSTTDAEVMVHTMNCRKNESYFLCFGRQSIPSSALAGTTTLGGCFQKDVVVNGTMYFRSLSPSPTGPWSVGSVTTITGDFYEAPTYKGANENQMWRWPSDDDDGLDIGYQPKVAFRLRGSVVASDGIEVTSAAGVRIVLSGPVKV